MMIKSIIISKHIPLYYIIYTSPPPLNIKKENMIGHEHIMSMSQSCPMSMSQAPSDTILMTKNQINDILITQTLLFTPNIIWDHVLSHMITIIDTYESHFDHNYNMLVLIAMIDLIII